MPELRTTRSFDGGTTHRLSLDKDRTDLPKASKQLVEMARQRQPIKSTCRTEIQSLAYIRKPIFVTAGPDLRHRGIAVGRIFGPVLSSNLHADRNAGSLLDPPLDKRSWPLWPSVLYVPTFSRAQNSWMLQRFRTFLRPVRCSSSSGPFQYLTPHQQQKGGVTSNSPRT